MDSLVLMACSATKLSVASPAFDLYQGVMYETFRAHVKSHARPNVIILSALHGFVEPERIISPYEQKMTSARADEMVAGLMQFMGSVQWPRSVRRVFLAGGLQYRRVMKAAVALAAADALVDECSGGIGFQRSQLGRYLDELAGRAGAVVGYHPNGTALLERLGGFSTWEQVLIKYRSAPWVAPRAAVIRELFDGPCGPTASVELIDGKPGRVLTRWVGLADIQKHVQDM